MARMVDVIGVGPMRVLMDKFGGQRVYVPSKMGGNLELLEVLGTEVYTQMHAVFKGKEIYIPSGRASKRAAEIKDLVDQGYTRRKIAQIHGVTEGRISQILAKLRKNQQSL
jgi:Mor family transcriptional regulator